MSIYISGIEMPSHGSIKLTIRADGFVQQQKEKPDYEPPNIGEAIDVPPHGRLIDKDALEQDISESVVFSGRGQNAELIGAKKIINRLHCAPTILEAEEGE